MTLTREQRECFNSMCQYGGINISVLRAVAAYITHLEDDNARLVEKANEVMRATWADKLRSLPEAREASAVVVDSDSIL